MKQLFVETLSIAWHVLYCERNEIEGAHIIPKARSAQVGDIYVAVVADVQRGMDAVFCRLPGEEKGFLPLHETTKALHQGEKIVVQVKKEATAGKVAKLSMKVEFATEHCVYFPYERPIAISQKIAPERQQQWREQLAALCQSNEAVMLRTAGDAWTIDEARAYIESCREQWQKWQRSEKAPLALRVPHPLEQLVKRYEQASWYVADDETRAFVRAHGIADVYNDSVGRERWQPLFARVVPLANGGELVIEETEALTVIDINSAKAKASDREQLALETNRLAALAIAKQVRLRNIGGVVVIDFINMKQKVARDDVWQTLKAAVQHDEAQVRIYPYTATGLVEMTRQRTGETLQQQATTKCAVCEGTGRNASLELTLHEVERELERWRSDYDYVALEVPSHLVIPEAVKQRWSERWHGLTVLIGAVSEVVIHPCRTEEDFLRYLQKK